MQIRNTVLLVTQFRQPCWKLNVRFKIRDMSLRMQRTGRTGWYYRVLKEGQVQEGDAVSLIERPHPQWPLSRLIELYYSGKVDRAALEEILKLPLPLAWHKTIQKRIETGVVESWDRRLFGKARPKRA